MILTIRELKILIREAFRDPNERDTLSPNIADREKIQQMSMKTIDDEYELSPHLLDAENNVERSDFHGPVPPNYEDPAFYALVDPYVKDWSVLSRGPHDPK